MTDIRPNRRCPDTTEMIQMRLRLNICTKALDAAALKDEGTKEQIDRMVRLCQPS